MQVRVRDQSGVLTVRGRRRGTGKTEWAVLCLIAAAQSLLENAGSFIKPLNPAESFKSSRHQLLPPQRMPEVRAERYVELRILNAFSDWTIRR